MEGIESFFVCMITQADYIMNDGANHNKNGVPGCYIKQAQLRLCKLGPGTVFSIRFFSEIKILSVALLSQAFLVVGCMLTTTYNFQAKFQLPT